MAGAAEQRRARSAEDHAALAAVSRASTLFAFEAEGTPPERYTFLFHGRGISAGASGAIDILDSHRCDVRLPSAYPTEPPDICWLTPLFHPNIPFGGIVRLEDIGLPWDPSIGLEVVCERLWDVARFAFVDLDRSVNSAAKQWYESQREILVPVDPRPLRNSLQAANNNVVRYYRRGQTATVGGFGNQGDLFYIDDDTPSPPLPRSAEREEVWYLGDEDR